MGQVLDARTRYNRRKGDLEATGLYVAQTSGTSGASGLPGGGGGDGSGSTPDPPIVPQPLQSPWYQDTLNIPASGSDTHDFGPSNVIKSAIINFYIDRAGTVWTGRWRIIHDGTTPTLYSVFSNPAAIDLTPSASIVGGRLILTVTDAVGTASTVKISFCYEGVTAASASGPITVVRGTRVGCGDWSVANDPTSGALQYQLIDGDDCGIVITGSVAAGTLDVVANADASDGNSTSVSMSGMVRGVNGAMDWQRFNLTVPSGGSDSQSFRSDIAGTVDWQNAQLDIPDNDSQTYEFAPQRGVVYMYYEALRNDVIECGETMLWNDNASGGGGEGPRIGYFNAVGVTFAVSLTGASIVLTVTSDASGGVTIFRFGFLTDAKI